MTDLHCELYFESDDRVENAVVRMYLESLPLRYMTLSRMCSTGAFLISSTIASASGVVGSGTSPSPAL